MREKRGSQNIAGFTLVEIFLVILLLSIIAGLTIPNLARSSSQFKLSETTNNLSSLIFYAQAKAISNRQKYQLRLDEDRSSYWIVREGPEASLSKEDEYVKVPGRWGRHFSVPRGVDLSLDQERIDFQEDGRISKARIYICVQEKCMTVSTREQSGYIKTFEGKIE